MPVSVQSQPLSSHNHVRGIFCSRPPLPICVTVLQMQPSQAPPNHRIFTASRPRQASRNMSDNASKFFWQGLMCSPTSTLWSSYIRSELSRVKSLSRQNSSRLQVSTPLRQVLLCRRRVCDCLRSDRVCVCSAVFSDTIRRVSSKSRFSEIVRYEMLVFLITP